MPPPMLSKRERWLPALLAALLASLIVFLAPLDAHAERLRDLGQFQGVRSNQLTGYGVVVGLGVSARDGSNVTINIPTVGRIAEGGSVERAVSTGFEGGEALRWNLFNSDFLTAARVRDAINTRLPGTATVEDGVTVALRLPGDPDTRASMMAAIEMIDVDPAETPARVIVNSRTGTVVINSAVRLSPAAISHGKLTVRIQENPMVVQPAPFSRGRTEVEQNSAIDTEEEKRSVALFKGGASLSRVVDALNLLGVTPSDLVAILEALKQAGALKAEMVVI